MVRNFEAWLQPRPFLGVDAREFEHSTPLVAHRNLVKQKLWALVSSIRHQRHPPSHRHNAKILPTPEGIELR